MNELGNNITSSFGEVSQIDVKPERLKEEYLLKEDEFLALSNIIIYNACRIYTKEFKNFHVPGTFIKFYFHELSGYDHLFDAKLRAYFDRANSRQTRMSVLMRSFATNFPLYVTKFGSDDFVDFLEVNDSTIPNEVLYNSESNPYFAQSLDSLKLVIKHYSNSDELRGVEYLFKDYLFTTYKADIPLESEDAAENEVSEQNEETDEIDKIIKNKQFSDDSAMQKYTEVKSQVRKSNAALLTGRAIELPTQKGKVVSVLFPELPLPCDYPTLIEKSRVDTRRKAKKFALASTEIELINNFRFVQVKYSLDFINKRKVVAHDLKRASRFDFKF